MLAINFLTALAVAAALTPICRVVARRFGFVARPSDDRWHKRTTPLFGGVAIVLAASGVGLALQWHADLWRLVGCGFAIATFGLLDDMMALKPSTKLVAQITFASLLVFYGYRLQWTESMVADSLLTLFWIVGITNAFNLLDNMDGLCAGTALIGGAFLLLVFVADGAAASPYALYLAALLGATAGFLFYNFNPASIFMGDAGSLFLGINIAALSLVPDPATLGRSGLLSVVAVPVLPLLIPILDTTFVTALRLLSGRSPSQGGRDHMSHRLVAVGLSERWAVMTLWTLAAAGGLISVLLHRRDTGWGIIAGLTFALALIIFAVYLARIRVYGEGDLKALEGQSFTPLVANFMYKRRVAEVLLDLCLIPIAYYTAYRLRFEGTLYTSNYKFFIQSLPLVIVAQLIALFVVGAYRGTWRHFGMMDAVTFGKGVGLGTIAAEILILYLYRFESYSRAVFVIDAALLVLLLSGSRASFRLVAEFILRRSTVGRRCVIYGTGGASQATIREAFGPGVTLRLLGYIDDDPLQRKMRVGGYSVLGDYRLLLDLVEQVEIDCVVLNTPIASVERLQELERRCSAHHIDLLRLHIDLKPLSAAAS